MGVVVKENVDACRLCLCKEARHIGIELVVGIVARTVAVIAVCGGALPLGVDDEQIERNVAAAEFLDQSELFLGGVLRPFRVPGAERLDAREPRGTGYGDELLTERFGIAKGEQNVDVGVVGALPVARVVGTAP